MLEILRTDDGSIKGVCEYYVVDEAGNFQANGEFVWVAELEIAPQFRHEGLIKEFIKRIIDKVPQAKFGYFWRQKKYPQEKYSVRKHIRIYHKARWLKLLGGSNGWR